MSGDACPECGETLESATAEQVEKLVGTKCGSDDLIQEAEERSQEISENQKRQQEVKDQLRERVRGYWENDEISEDHAEKLLNLIDRGQYGRVRSELEDIREDSGMEYSADLISTDQHHKKKKVEGRYL